MIPLPWACKKEESDKANYLQQQAKIKSKACQYQRFAKLCLEEYLPGIKFGQNLRWGFRIFDFFSGIYGIAFDINFIDHDVKKCNHEDEWNFRKSGIIVLRLRFDHIEDDIKNQLYYFDKTGSWSSRREELGITKNYKVDKAFIKQICFLPENSGLFKKYKESIKKNCKIHLKDLL